MSHTTTPISVSLTNGLDNPLTFPSTTTTTHYTNNTKPILIDDVLGNVMNYLPKSSLLMSSLTCKNWRRVMQDQSVFWRRSVMHKCVTPYVTPEQKHFRQVYQEVSPDRAQDVDMGSLLVQLNRRALQHVTETSERLCPNRVHVVRSENGRLDHVVADKHISFKLRRRCGDCISTVTIEESDSSLQVEDQSIQWFQLYFLLVTPCHTCLEKWNENALTNMATLLKHYETNPVADYMHSILAPFNQLTVTADQQIAFHNWSEKIDFKVGWSQILSPKYSKQDSKTSETKVLLLNQMRRSEEDDIQIEPNYGAIGGAYSLNYTANSAHDPALIVLSPVRVKLDLSTVVTPQKLTLRSKSMHTNGSIRHNNRQRGIVNKPYDSSEEQYFFTELMAFMKATDLKLIQDMLQSGKYLGGEVIPELTRNQIEELYTKANHLYSRSYFPRRWITSDGFYTLSLALSSLGVSQSITNLFGTTANLTDSDSW